MSLEKLSKNDLKIRIINLMEDVKIHLNEEPDVDKFLDETKLFDEWELVLPQHEYPILVMAVLNDIRRENIINSIVDSIIEEKRSHKPELTTKTNFENKENYVGEHPFN